MEKDLVSHIQHFRYKIDLGISRINPQWTHQKSWKFQLLLNDVLK